MLSSELVTTYTSVRKILGIIGRDPSVSRLHVDIFQFLEEYSVKFPKPICNLPEVLDLNRLFLKTQPVHL